MLQRIYGTAWASKKDLDAHLHRLEEAEQRDHRKLGAELDLFSFPDEIGSGLAVFHPKGGIVRQLMEDYSPRSATSRPATSSSTRRTSRRRTCSRRRGHLDWYADGMYPPMELDGGTEYYLKPMNCPFHILIYQSRQRSLPRAAAAAVRVRHGVPLREVRRGARAHARARHDPGRRPHLLHQGADGRRARARCSTSCSTCCATSASTTSTSSCRPSPPGKSVGTDEEWDEATEALRAVAPSAWTSSS